MTDSESSSRLSRRLRIALRLLLGLRLILVIAAGVAALAAFFTFDLEPLLAVLIVAFMFFELLCRKAEAQLRERQRSNSVQDRELAVHELSGGD